jgi:diguanylate cyclase (GGDEF)-like protein
VVETPIVASLLQNVRIDFPHPMYLNYTLIFNAAVSLIMGSALILVWHRDRTQVFTRYLGWANMVQLLVPVSYFLTTRSPAQVAMIGWVSLPIAAATYTTLLAAGTSHLALRPLGKRALWSIFTVLGLTYALAISGGNLSLAQSIVAVTNTLLGLVCTYWLWRMGSSRLSPEELVGPLLVLLGLIQFIYVTYQADGAALLATLGGILRVALGLVLLYAALERGLRSTRKLQRRFEQLTARSHQGILINRLDTTTQTPQILYANKACMNIYGVHNLGELEKFLLKTSIPKAERGLVARMFEDIEHGLQDDVSYEAQRERQDGTPLWLHFQCFRTEWDGASAVQVLISDDTERHQAHEALCHQALHDELTGLPNRTALLLSLRQRCDGVAGMSPFVLILIDIDRFKLFNEAHGHSMGDQVLKVFGQSVRAVIEARHEVLRVSEDEFAIISAADCKGEVAVELATCVRDMLSKPMAIAGGEYFLDTSLGIALFPNSAQDAESLLRAANSAMYVAKRTPGTSYKLAEKKYERGASNALEQEQALRSGIERGEFHLMYQPKVDAHTGLLTSFEALARWNRPRVGSVSPVEFIAAAERTGLIGALGTTLLKQACIQIAVWQAADHPCVPVAVNVSPLQLLDPRFPMLVSQLLQTHNVRAQHLTLEITESSAVQNLEQTVTQIHQLRELGVHVAMDDFGTGYSSLNLLRTLRLHTVKIDRGLIDPLPQADSIAVVRAICQLADALHLSVVAEGVETREQSDAARDAGCQELQGYLYARPLSPQDASTWLQTRTLTSYPQTDGASASL